MGHLRLGRLPKTRRWSEVVDLLEADPTDAARITSATVVAAEAHLQSLPRNDSLTYAFWLLRSDLGSRDRREGGHRPGRQQSALVGLRPEDHLRAVHRARRPSQLGGPSVSTA